MSKRTRLLCVSILVVLLLGGCLTVQVSFPGDEQQPVRSLDGLAVSNNETVRLPAGSYEGSLVINANNATILGAGIGRTVIRGRITINGNTNEVRGVTVSGTVTINGNSNDLSRCDLFDANVTVNGNNNRY